MRRAGRPLDDLRDIQADEQNPNDCAREPHEVTHRVDAVRYYAIQPHGRRRAPRDPPSQRNRPRRPGDGEAYDDFMTGRGVDDSYLGYA